MIDAETFASPPETPCPAGHGPPAHPERPVVWAVLLASVGLAIVFPAIEWGAQATSPKVSRFLADETWFETLPVVAAGALIAAWFFIFWSLIGSFLNVVVYRLPMGQSVVHGGSRCPRCQTPIKWHDNLPVIGWLTLSGRCRACSLPIAARYPIVESVCAGLCTAVYFRELVSGGSNLPGRSPDPVYGGVLRLFPNLSTDLVGITLYHCVAIAVLLVWGLIAWDRREVPGRSIAWVLIAAATLPLLLPSLHPLGLTGGTTGPETPWLWRGLGVSAAGGLAGLFCGLVLHALLATLLQGDASGRTGQPLWPPHRLAAGLSFVGIVFGWQGVVGTTTLLLMACLVQALVWSAVTGWPTLPVETLLLPATFVHLVAWRQLTEQWSPWWPGGQTTPACLALPLAMMLTLASALAAIAPAPHRSVSRSRDQRRDAETAVAQTTGSRASEAGES